MNLLRFRSYTRPDREQRVIRLIARAEVRVNRRRHIFNAAWQAGNVERANVRAVQVEQAVRLYDALWAERYVLGPQRWQREARISS